MTNVSTEGWLLGYDAVDQADEPTDGRVYYGYADGAYKDVVPASLPGYHLTIAVDDTTLADEYDVEQGNQDNPVDWAARMRAAGREPVVYCNTATVPGVLTHFDQAGALPPYIRLADWTDQVPAEVPDYGAGTVGVQYADDAGYDVNLISPRHPGILRQQAPAEPPRNEAEMPHANSNPAGKLVLSWPAGTCHVVQVLADNGEQPPLELRLVLFSAGKGVYVPPSNLTQDEYGRIVWELPADTIKDACGVALEQQGATANQVLYGACAV